MQKLLHINSIQWLKPFWRKKNDEFASRTGSMLWEVWRGSRGSCLWFQSPTMEGQMFKTFLHTSLIPNAEMATRGIFGGQGSSMALVFPWSRTCRSGPNGARAADRKQKALPPKLVNAKRGVKLMQQEIERLLEKQTKLFPNRAMLDMEKKHVLFVLKVHHFLWPGGFTNHPFFIV